jgi:UDP-N-acetylglucosamine 2-epimerase
MVNVMSKVEDILMEAWNLGINSIVMEKVTKKQEDLKNKGNRWVNMTELYEQSLEEAKKEQSKNRMNGSRNR